MPRQKRTVEEHENVERWLVSYADFITLLFAFFVVMYAVSSVNEGKYRVLSNSLEAAFSETRRSLQPMQSLQPIQIGEAKTLNPPIAMVPPIHAAPPAPVATADSERQALVEEVERERMRLVQVSEQIAEVLSEYVDQELIEVKRDDFWIEVEMKSGILFESGNADLSEDAQPVLEKLAEVFKRIPNALQVEGHTDDFPIQTLQFPSNWELSAARAARVVRHFEALGVRPERMSAIGYGEFHPVADNKFEEGRYKNRRVVVILLSQSATRHHIAAGDGSHVPAPAQTDFQPEEARAPAENSPQSPEQPSETP